MFDNQQMHQCNFNQLSKNSVSEWRSPKWRQRTHCLFIDALFIKTVAFAYVQLLLDYYPERKMSIFLGMNMKYDFKTDAYHNG